MLQAMQDAASEASGDDEDEGWTEFKEGFSFDSSATDENETGPESDYDDEGEGEQKILTTTNYQKYTSFSFRVTGYWSILPPPAAFPEKVNDTQIHFIQISQAVRSARNISRSMSLPQHCVQEL
ncbi:hypothetical protein D9756_002871 [Leucocoprinus leucothites]|uniref:Uncharacterized protein n=1 Tax=Leucocoprinus leucothites TaxID=201217 RepID=A0A8H5LJQ7_9AGAR|nr:hypothetical protein D9756_002871 [Leucoagaricus leucothites]